MSLITIEKKEFLLRNDIIFLNHGAFGACPQFTFNIYQDWQKRLEAQPVEFFGRELQKYLKTSREKLACYVNADSKDIVFIPNSTHGVNIIAAG